MQRFSWQRIFVYFWAIFLAGAVWTNVTPTALAFNNPDLLPATPTPIIDLAKSLTSVQEDKLGQELDAFQVETGWKLRVLTQYDRTPGTAVKSFWGLDEKSILLVADSRGGNILNFSIGDAVYDILPRTFWIELQTRFGNLYFVREEGEDQAIIQALGSIEGCLRQGGCRVVPGLPREQWILTLISSVLGGVICGFAGQSRSKGQGFSWQWALIFSPLWGILFLAFGIAPVITRTSEWLPLVRNISGFLIGVLVAFLSPIFSRPPASEN